MRKLAVLLGVIVSASVTAALASTGKPTYAGNGVTIDVPAGWHLIRRHITDVYDPAQRLAMTSFDLGAAGYRTCECGTPGFRSFPRNGVFLFVWEYVSDRRRMLSRIPTRPVRFHITSSHPQRGLCDGPSDEFGFKDAGRVFQVEVYLGPKTTSGAKAQLQAALDSFHADAAH